MAYYLAIEHKVYDSPPAYVDDLGRHVIRMM